MNEGKKYIRRTDLGLVREIDQSLWAILQPFLDQAGLPYEVLAAPPPEPAAPEAPPTEGVAPPKRQK